MNLQGTKNSFFTPLSDWASYLILVFAFLAPFFFIPDLSINESKGFFTVAISLIAFALFLASIIVKGRFSITKSFLILSLAFLPLAALLASFFSDSFLWSLVGPRFEIGTFGFIFSAAALGILTSAVFNSMGKIRTLFHYLLFSSIVLFLLQVAFFLGGQSVNLVGRLSDLGIFFGLITLISLTFLSFRRNLHFKWLYITALVLSFFGVLISGFQLVVIILGVLSIIFFLYLVSSSYTSGRNMAVLAPSFFIFLISFLFVLGGAGAFTYLSEQAGIAQVEVQPTLQTTMDIGVATMSENPVFGSGPNTFAWQWQQNKPDAVNLSNFWNADFNSGFGLIPTFLTTMGALGFLLWVMVPAIILYLGFKHALSSGITGDTSSDDPQKKGYFLSAIAFISTLYLWFFLFVHVPGQLVLALTFLLTGAFIASLTQLGIFQRLYVDFYQQKQKSILIHTIAILLLIIVSAGLLYSYSAKVYSIYQHNKGLAAFELRGDFESAERSLTSAASVNPSDFVYRRLSDLYLARFNQLILDEESQAGNEEAANELQALIDLSLSNALSAIQANPSNHVNWLSLAGTYHNLASLQVEGSVDRAKSAYQSAFELSPKDPSIQLSMANLELLRDNTEQAFEHIDLALELKDNYRDAIFLRSAIDFRMGQRDQAISTLESLAAAAPFDDSVFFELGALQYTNGDYASSSEAFRRALAINPEHLNARFYLGLSYGQAGLTEEATTEFQRLSEALPENQQISAILNSLQAGQGLGIPEPTVDEL